MIKLHFQLVFIAAVSLGLAAENPNPVTLGGFQAVSLNSSMKIQYEISEFELQQIDQDGKNYVKKIDRGTIYSINIFWPNYSQPPI